MREPRPPRPGQAALVVLGVYGSTVEPGRVAVGDVVVLEERSSAAERLPMRLRVARELQSICFRLLSPGGAALGLLYAVQRWHAKPVACRPGHDCVARNLMPNLMPILLWTGGGAIAGALVAVLLIRLARALR